MLEVGRRIIFDKKNGEIICELGEYKGEKVQIRNKINELDFIDLPYGKYYEKFINCKKYHIDIETKEIVFDEFYEKIETEEEKLKREKLELENQLLLKENKELGGVL